MMMQGTFMFLLTAVLLATTTPPTTGARAVQTHGWTPMPTDDVPMTHRVRLMLRPAETCTDAALASAVAAVSSPGSPSYGAYWDMADLAAACTLPRLDQTARHVASALGVPPAAVTRAPLGDALYVDIPVSTTMAKLCAGPDAAAPVVVAVYVRGTARMLRCSGPVDVPEPLAALGVVAIAGLDDFPPRRRTRLMPVDEVGGGFPGVDIVPDTIIKAYNVSYPAAATSTTTSSSSSKTAQAVAEFEQAYFHPYDLTGYLEQFGAPPLVQPITIVGKNDPDSKDAYLDECSLDLEVITAIGRGVPTWDFSVGPFDLVEWSNKVLAAAAASPGTAPKVHSISWGSAEEDFPDSQLNATNAAFAKMALLGYTLVCASGDDGTGRTGVLSCRKFAPTFPASSPYCLSVGATYLPSASAASQPAVSFSGGGFSTYFERPAWQDAAVSAYLDSGVKLPDQKYWNKPGAAIPDVAALGTNFKIVAANYTGIISGTSAATPVWAGLLGQINEARAAQGSPLLGHVAPLLYALGSVGHDVTEGDNKVAFCDRGFEAAPGWDPVSGLGTPNFGALVDALTHPARAAP